MRIVLREHAYLLANILEIKWHQRARTKWLKEWDRNTSYFHTLAICKNRKKHISELVVEDARITDELQILSEFTRQYVQLLGTQATCTPLNLHTLYPDTPTIYSLTTPFQEQEVKHAVMGLSINKSSGLDGLPNEFFKLHWDMVKKDLLAIFADLFKGTLDLQQHNLAHIVLIPKEEGANTVSSFRPISIINYVPKLISKVLSNHLANHIPSLISTSQTDFVKGRLISKNFNTARECVSHILKTGEPTILLKLDFQKAFDTVAWPFLFQILRHRGLPSSFVSRAQLLFYSSTSMVNINGRVGESFKHKRGLRQGDPLSPYLFLLAADVMT